MSHGVLLVGGAGYLGSRIFEKFSSLGFDVTSVDLEWFEPPDFPNIKMDYKDLKQDFIRMFDTVVFLAGHSNVQHCERERIASLHNNCLNFFRFVEKLNDHQRFIYASSGSVYGFKNGTFSREDDPLWEPIQEYDRQKQMIDYYMVNSNKKFYGLRFGTVCGYSPNPRNTLMINSMVRSGLTEGVVKVTNAQSYRAILGMEDLCSAIVRIVLGYGRSQSTFYNLASVNLRIDEIGGMVADLLRCRFEAEGGIGEYSFKLLTRKFESEFDFPFRETVESMVEAAKKNKFSVNR